MQMQTPIDVNPNHAMALGRVLANTATMEMGLLFLMETLLGLGQKRTQVLLGMTNSLAAKIDVVTHLVELSDIAPDLKPKILSVLSAGKKANSERNKYVHSIWGAGVDGELTRIEYSNAKGHVTKNLTAADINDFADELGEITMKLQWISATLNGIPQADIDGLSTTS